jgi:hypothetical protein
VLPDSTHGAEYIASTQASIVELMLTASLAVSTSLPQIVMFYH